MDANQLACADENGQVSLWDTRQPDPAASVQLHQDHVTDLACQPNAHRLLSTSGDGNLGIMDLRTHKV